MSILISSTVQPWVLLRSHNLAGIFRIMSWLTPEVLEGPPDEDETRTEVLITDFSRARTRLRFRYPNFRDRGRDEDLPSFFAPSLSNFEDKMRPKKRIFYPIKQVFFFANALLYLALAIASETLYAIDSISECDHQQNDHHKHKPFGKF